VSRAIGSRFKTGWSSAKPTRQALASYARSLRLHDASSPSKSLSAKPTPRPGVALHPA
jgi:hypothetical protein